MADAQKYTFVLIHGLWHDGRCWAEVSAELQRAGHRAHAPTLAGHGAGQNRGASHAEAVQSLVKYLDQQGLSDVVLVGHSFGGTVVSRVAEELPARIRRLVYSSGFITQDGESFQDLLPPPIREILGQLTQPDGGVAPLPFPAWRDLFAGDADLPTARRVYETLTPYPVRHHADPVPLKSFASLQIPRSFLLATEDVSLPPGEWGYHPRLSSRLGLYRLVSMPGGHVGFASNPARMAEKLIEAGRD